MQSCFTELILRHWLQFSLICFVLTFCGVRLLKAADPVGGIVRIIRALGRTLVQEELGLRMRAAIVNLILALLVFLLGVAILTPSLIQQFGFADEDIPRSAVVVFVVFCAVVVLSLWFIWKTREIANVLSDGRDR